MRKQKQRIAPQPIKVEQMYEKKKDINVKRRFVTIM